MTIDDAIVAFEQVASGDYDSLELDVRDYERLVKWLTELKLARESAFSDIGLAARAVSENHQLKSENAALRELVLDMYKAFMHGNCYRWCEFKEPCNYISDGRCQWYERMRDLEIEVDA